MATYSIKYGDTLGAIAAKNGTTVAELMKLNPQITDPNKIFAGANLNLPQGKTPSPASTSAPAAKAPTPSPVQTPVAQPVAPAPVAPPTPPAPISGSTPAPTGSDFITQMKALGLSDAQIARIQQDPMATQVLSAVSDVYAKTAETGKAIVFNNIQDFQKILADAQTDPTLAAKYGDSLKVGISSFNNNLEALKTNAALAGTQQVQQFTQDQKNLSEAEAAAGRAYSGFRTQAKGRLDTTEQGIVTSTKSQLDQQLKDLGSKFEYQFGSGALSGVTTPNVSYVNPLSGATENSSYSPLGLTGTDVTSKKQETEALAESRYASSALPQQ